MSLPVHIACTFTPAGLAAFHSQCPPGKTDILILPELFDGGYQRLHRDHGTASNLDELVERFAQVSQAHRLNLVAGTVAWPKAGGKLRSTCLVYVRGQKLAEIDKTHLFRPLGDDQYFEPGRPGPTLTLDCHGMPVRAGIIICYDLRFPETVRPWFKSGMDLLIVPARWPRVRNETWRLLLRARAIENQCFVVGVNARDAEGGGSYAFAPDGRPVFELEASPTADEPAWHSFTIDLDDIAVVKQRLDTRVDACLL